MQRNYSSRLDRCIVCIFVSVKLDDLRIHKETAAKKQQVLGNQNDVLERMLNSIIDHVMSLGSEDRLSG